MDGEVFDAMEDGQPKRAQDIVQFMYQAHAVRTLIDKEGQSWFCGTDVCDVLGYANPRSAVSAHCDDLTGVAKYDTDTSGGRRSLQFVNEANLYLLIFGCKLPAAKAFRLWVTQEVLPTLRTRGVYTLDAQVPTSSRISTEEIAEACRAVAKLPAANEALKCQVQRLQLKLVEKDMHITALEGQSKARESLVAVRLASLHHAAFLYSQGRGFANIAHLLGTDLETAEAMVTTWQTLSKLRLAPVLEDAVYFVNRS